MNFAPNRRLYPRDAIAVDGSTPELDASLRIVPRRPVIVLRHVSCLIAPMPDSGRSLGVSGQVSGEPSRELGLRYTVAMAVFSRHGSPAVTRRVDVVFRRRMPKYNLESHVACAPMMEQTPLGLRL